MWKIREVPWTVYLDQIRNHGQSEHDDHQVEIEEQQPPHEPKVGHYRGPKLTYNQDASRFKKYPCGAYLSPFPPPPLKIKQA